MAFWKNLFCLIEGTLTALQKTFCQQHLFFYVFRLRNSFVACYNRFYWIQTCPLDICFLNDFFSCGRFSKFSSRRACCFLSIIFSYMVQSCQLQLTLKFSIDSVGKRYSWNLPSQNYYIQFSRLWGLLVKVRSRQEDFLGFWNMLISLSDSLNYTFHRNQAFFPFFCIWVSDNN